MAKVLIYGFGWSGQSMLKLCERIGFTCDVLDEGLDISLTNDRRFIGFSTLKDVYDIYLICVVEEKIALKMTSKLLNLGIDEKKIRYFSDFSYKEKMSYLAEKYFKEPKEVLQEWLNEEKKMPFLCAKIEALVQEYRQNKRIKGENELGVYENFASKHSNLSAFARIYESALIKSDLININYPGFSVGVSFDKREDRNFYFIEEIDFIKVAKRSNDTKLIVCLGNSALRVEYLPLNEAITSYMKEEIKDTKCMVLNLGITGYTIYEQIMLYNALVYPLKPDVVVSFFFGTDFRSGFVDCENLVKKHKMLYGAWWYEGDYKKRCKSELPLLCEMNTNKKAFNHKIKDEDIYEAILVRLNQFNQIVSAGGGGLLCLYTALTCLQARMERGRKKYA